MKVTVNREATILRHGKRKQIGDVLRWGNYFSQQVVHRVRSDQAATRAILFAILQDLAPSYCDVLPHR